MKLALNSSLDKTAVFVAIRDYIRHLSLEVSNCVQDKPWGGYFVINEAQTLEFITYYFPEFPELSVGKNSCGNRLSPKILVIAPTMRFSWQYHNRRTELWKNIGDTVDYATSTTDDPGPILTLKAGETVQFTTKVRHRLIGLENWGIVAEIWQHTDPNNPSDENDIVRIADDFGR